MEFYHEKARHCSMVHDYFNFDNLDAFYSEDILNVIYGSNWESILITDNGMAFFHTFSRKKIDGTDQYDIEPFLGYSGPIVNTYDPDFIDQTINTYSCFCSENNIIAEIIRFNPIAENHIPFEKSDAIEIIPAKEIVIVNCLEDENKQLQNFSSKSARYRVHKGKRTCSFRELDKHIELNSFIELYKNSIISIHADKKWLLPSGFFKRIQNGKHFKILGVFHEDKLVSASLVILYNAAAYYLLAANTLDKVPGSNELLIVRINQFAAMNNIPFLILGGGNSVSPEDPLLRFKKKFSQKTYKFHIGKMIHIQEAYDEMCVQATNIDKSLNEIKYHLKYRLLAS